MLRKKNTGWIIIADGSKARIFVSDSNKHNLRPLLTESFNTARLHSYDLGSKKPHGVFEMNRPEARVNLHNKEKNHFAQHIANIINLAANNAEFQYLTIAAPPKFLGYLRHYMNQSALSLIRKVIHKDLTHLKNKELKDYIW